MKKANWRFLVDALLFVTILGIVLIGFLLGFVLPKGPTAAESSKYFLGLHRHQWGDIHLYLGIAFTALAVLHLILGWSWVKGKARQLFSERWRVALISVPVVAFAVLVVFWAFSPKSPELYEDYGKGAGELAELEGQTDHVLSAAEGVLNSSSERMPRLHAEEEEQRLTRGRRSEDVSGVLITGQMTLCEIASQSGVSARALAERLALPSSAPLEERLGRLRKTNHFTIQDVRDALAGLLEDRQKLSRVY